MTARSLFHVNAVLASLVCFVLVTGCSGKQLSSSVEDQSMVSEPAEVEVAEPMTDPMMAEPAPEFEEEPYVAEPEPMVEEAYVGEPEPMMEMESEAMLEGEPAMEEFAAEPEPMPDPMMETEPEPMVGFEPETEDPFMAEAEPSMEMEVGEMEMATEPEPMVEETIEPEPFMEPEPVMSALVLDDIYFDFDRFSIRGDARDALEANANLLRERDDWTLTIEGHCDERGTIAYNLVLGERRAEAVKRYLEDLGVPGYKIDIVSYGKERPFCFDQSEECWQENRRAHFVY